MIFHLTILQALEAPDFVTTDGIYCHSDSVDDMERALEHVVLEQIREKLKNSDFIGIIIDETVNITVNKKLIVYLKLEIKGKVETCFLGNYDVDSGTARYIYDRVVAVLREMDIALSRVIVLGSDGASVMREGMVGLVLCLSKRIPFLSRCTALPTGLHLLRWTQRKLWKTSELTKTRSPQCTPSTDTLPPEQPGSAS